MEEFPTKCDPPIIQETDLQNAAVKLKTQNNYLFYDPDFNNKLRLL